VICGQLRSPSILASVSDSTPRPTASAPTADGLRRSLLDDVVTGDLAAILGVPIERYVDAVVASYQDASSDPTLQVVDTEALKQQGCFLDVPLLDELHDWLNQVASGNVALRSLTGGSFPGAGVASARRKASWVTGADMNTAAPVVSAPPRGTIEVDDTDIGRAVKAQVARATTMVRTQRAALPPLPKSPPKPAAAEPKPDGRSSAKGGARSALPPRQKIKPPIKASTKSSAAPSRASPGGPDSKFKDDPNARLKDRLAQLKEAYDSGLLTQAEYAHKKRELMRDFGAK